MESALCQPCAELAVVPYATGRSANALCSYCTYRGAWALFSSATRVVRDGYSICATSPRLPFPPGPLLPGRRGRGFTLARPPFFFLGYVEARAETGPTPPLLNTQRALHIRSDAQRAISFEAKPDTETEHGYGCGCGVACGRMFPRKTTRTAQYLEAAKKRFF